MKRALAVGCMCALALFTTTCSQGAKAPAKKTELKADLDKISYAIGMDIAKSLKGFPGELDIATVQQGLDDAFRGNTTLLTPEQAQEVQATAFAKMRGAQEEKNKEATAKNLKEGAEFLEKNKSAEGVKVTASGLQYQVLTQGKGAKPKATEIVTVNYKGTLLDGKEFDSSYKRGQPATFPVNGVIPGWTEALQLMAVGSKYKLFIPSALGYGERGAGGDIGPNATLIFEVELLSIGEPKPAAAPAAAK